MKEGKKHFYLCSITDEKCYFCDVVGIIRFKEHYLFCPNCGAIYTNCILIKKTCNHVTKGTILLVDPLFLPNKTLKPHIKGFFDKQKCSVCGAEAIADGW